MKIKTILFLLLFINFISCVEIPEPIIKTSYPVNATIIFEQGKTDFEKGIMNLNAYKCAQLGISAPTFSHVKIMIGNRVWETHPNHGVICNTFDESTENREFVDVYLKNIDHVIAKLEYADSTANRYNYAGAAALGQYTISGVYVGRANPETYHCASLVAYAIGVQDWWVCDIVDLWIITNN